MSLPFPGRYESHTSWMRRCDDYDRQRQRWNAELNARHTNWGGYNYTPVRYHEAVTLPDGSVVLAAKIVASAKNENRVRKFAEKRGLLFAKVKNGPAASITTRTDCVAYYPPGKEPGMIF